MTNHPHTMTTQTIDPLLNSRDTTFPEHQREIGWELQAVLIFDDAEPVSEGFAGTETARST